MGFNAALKGLMLNLVVRKETARL